VTAPDDRHYGAALIETGPHRAAARDGGSCWPLLVI